MLRWRRDGDHDKDPAVTRFSALSIGIGVVGFVVGLVVSKRDAPRSGDTLPKPLALVPEPGDYQRGTYAFGFVTASRLWKVTMNSATVSAA